MGVCHILVQLSLFGTGIAYTITSAISMRAIQKSICYQKEGHEAAYNFGNTTYMLLFGIVQIVLSQIPEFHKLQYTMAIDSCYSHVLRLFFHWIGLGLAKVIGMLVNSLVHYLANDSTS
ncbi:putative amino acid permease 7 [Quercus suber]|uniref:Amino acid permease 7 n=1 Tax=Quercus suber TaxID=58331 RepID=A0AAW0M9W5_QUESU